MIKGVSEIDNIILITVGVVAASCFFGVAAYLMSVFNQITYSNAKKEETVDVLESLE